MEELRDIKPNLTIIDPTFWILVVITILLVIFFIYLSLKLKTKFFNQEKSKKDIARSTLLNLNLSNSKQTSYDIAKFSYILAKTDDQKASLKELLKHLENYKYQLNAPPFKDKDKEMIEAFMKEFNAF